MPRPKFIYQSNLDWQYTYCPICGQQYSYLPQYKPKTCGKTDCVHKALERGLIYANKCEGG